MIAVDTNILVYAHREDSPFHGAAFERVAELAEGRAAWSIPWPCVDEFVSVVTHPRIYAPPTPLALALDQVDAWLESPTLVLLAESPSTGRSCESHTAAPVSAQLKSTTPASPLCADSTACGSCGRRIATLFASQAARS